MDTKEAGEYTQEEALLTYFYTKESLYSSMSMSASDEETDKSVFNRLTKKRDAEMIQDRVVMAKG